MKKIIVGAISLVIVVVVLYFGYAVVRTLNGNPLAMPKAEKLADAYLKLAYGSDDLNVDEGTYVKNYGNYNFDVKEPSGTVVNELVIQEGLKVIEDTNKTKELNDKVEQYVKASTLSIESMEVNGTEFFTSDHFVKKDDIWITFSGNDLTPESVANFGKGLSNWSRKNDISLNKLTIDFTNTDSNESFRLEVDHNNLDHQSFVSLIEKIE